MNTNTGQKKIVLGQEFDEKLREELRATLQEFRGQSVGQWSGIGGSQELDKLEAIVEGKTIKVESETYIGLSISGDADVVERVAKRVRERMSN